MEHATISLEFFIQVGLIIMGLWTFYKVLVEIINSITKRHDREQKWDEYEKNLKEERDKIYTKYDGKLIEIEKKMEINEKLAQKERDLIKINYTDKITELENKIDYNHADMDAKTQELKSEILLLTKGLAAVLDAMIKNGSNGPVTEAKKEFDSYLISKL